MRSLSQWAFDLMAIWQRQRTIPGKMWAGTIWDPIPANEEARSSMDTLIVSRISLATSEASILI